MAFDANNDGVLDADELQTLSEQLNSQLADNNALLTQVRQLEEQNFELHKELHSQHDYFKPYEQEKTRLVSELEEAQQKLRVAEDVAQNLTRQLRDLRHEHSVVKSDAEALANETIKKGLDLEHLNREVNKYKRLLSEMEKQKSDLQHISNAGFSDLQHKYAEAMKMNESQKADIANLKTKLSVVDAERMAAIDDMNEMKIAYDELSASSEAAMLNKLQDEKKIKMLANKLEVSEDKVVDLENALEESIMQAEHTESHVEHLKAALKKSETKCEAAEESCIEMRIEVKKLFNEKNALAQQMERHEHELLVQTNRAKSESERKVEQLTAKQDELYKLLDQAQARYDDTVATYNQKISDMHQIRAELDNKYLAAQNECKEMHHLMDRLNNKHREEKQLIEAQRARLADELSAQRAEEEARSAKHAQELAKADEDIHAARSGVVAEKKQLLAACDKATEGLMGMQSKVKELEDLLQTSRAQCRDLGVECNTLRKRVAQNIDVEAATLASLKAEFLSALRAVATAQGQSQHKLEAQIDAALQAKVAKEEAIAQNLQLEEQVSRLEHQNASLQNKAGQQERDLLVENKRLTDALQRATEDDRAQEDRQRALTRSLEESQQVSRGLQEANQRLQAALDGRQSDHSDSMAEARQRIDQLTHQLARANEDKIHEMRKAEALQAKQALSQDEETEARTELARAAAQIEHLKKEHAAAMAKQQEALNTVGAATQQYHLQVQNTKELLKIAQAQKAELLKENEALRAQLE